jgi:cell division septal protein FtsQ
MAKRTLKHLGAAGCRSVREKKQICFRNSKKNPSSKPKRFFYAFIFIIFTGVITYSIFFSQFLAVTKIEINGTIKLDSAEIGKIAETETNGNFLNFIPRNNILLVSKTAIIKNILEKYKHAEKIEVTKIFPDKLDIQIKERKFSLVLCSVEKCRVIDNSGMAFAEADFEKNELGENDLPILYDDKNKKFALGEVVLEQDYINYLLSVKEKIKSELGIDLEREIRTPQIASGDIRVKTIEGWLVYFDKNIPLAKEIDMLKLVLENKIEQSVRTNLEYVDLRTENKVYYKFRDNKSDLF